MNIPETNQKNYITGISALNVPTEDNSSFGDWHFTETFLTPGTRFRVAGKNYPSTSHIFGNYGIRECSTILREYGVYVEPNRKVYVANYVRAVLDLAYNITKEHQSPDFLQLDDFLEHQEKSEVFHKIDSIKSKIIDTVQLKLLNQWQTDNTIINIENMNYNQEELEILDFMENGNYVSVPNVKEEMEEIKASVKEKLKQNKHLKE